MKTKICIASPLKPGVSETFIQKHLDLLPYETSLLRSLPRRGYHPIYDGDDNALFSDLKLINYIESGIDQLF